MKAAVLYKAKTPLVVEEIDFGNPQDNEVLVEMKASGVCHSDWHIIKGEWTQFNFPIVLGHEGAGIVEEVGSGVTSVKQYDDNKKRSAWSLNNIGVRRREVRKM